MAELPRIGVVTIQGGGALGVDLIGQLQGLVGPSHIADESTGDAGVAPVAIAGTSAGAIIACLYWLGYNPDEIREEMGRIFGRQHREQFFAGGCTKPRLSFEAFHRFTQILGSWTRPGAFSRFSFQWLMVPWWFWICRVRWKKARGLFEGKGFVEEIDGLIRRSRLVKDFAEALPKDRLITFGDIMAQADEKRVMPFFLIVTDVKAANMRVISCVWPSSMPVIRKSGESDGTNSGVVSSDADIPVALAVRASAGFPLFFTPASLQDSTTNLRTTGHDMAGGDCFVDGGVVSNFPSWVFAAGYRRSLLQSGNPVFADLAFMPWVHYGLRLPGPEPGDAHTIWPFIRRLGGLLKGAARARLEAKLAETVIRRRDVAATLPASGTAPNGALDFDFLTDKPKVNIAFARGRADGQRVFRSSDYMLPAPGELEPILKALAEEATSILARYLFEGGTVRTNIFVLNGDELKMSYHFGFADNDPDIDMRLRFNQGITGLSFTTRQAVLANVGEHKLGSEVQDKQDPFLKGDQAPTVRRDRTWLLSLPIIDLTESWPVAVDRDAAPLAMEYLGPVFGIINVDAPMNYASLGAPQADPQHGQHHAAARAVAHAMKLAAVRASSYFGAPNGRESNVG